MSENAVIAPWGYVGKIPAKGDFVQDGLPIDFINQWREWQQAVLAVSREQMGGNWQEHYLTAPIWHFALSPNVCGESPMIGTFIPSVDSVGRHFFFTLATEVPLGPAYYWCKPDWSDAIEPFILDVLDEHINLGQWAAQLKTPFWAEQLPAPDEATPYSPVRYPQIELINHQSPLSPTTLLDRQFRQARTHYCLWWTAGSDSVAACSLVTDGLPSISQYAAMLDGQWDKWCAQ
ncbi:type VI secretion system-associated protein TagF [Thaumasiovibrio subtropicus]|uniref:type VI secretion system-associated protein TagF n=1 Tax=Thaumasiovibrio subtropicus TaxID=1891207 RepID=UPI000B352157|nr:type VI secretion system-associated protein TagF [Thaumasiovibrio subtropicus]